MNGPLILVGRRQCPSKYGPACGFVSYRVRKYHATDEKDFLFTDEELPSGKYNLIENTPRLYGSRKDNDGKPKRLVGMLPRTQTLIKQIYCNAMG